MSLYEIESMAAELAKFGKPPTVTYEELAAQKEWLGELFKDDPSVKLK